MSYEQLSLFSFFETNPIKDAFVDQVLLTGGGNRNSRSRIFSKYHKGYDSTTMSKFLQKEYQVGGKGFLYEDETHSVWYDPSGVAFSKGLSAKHHWDRKLTWEEVEGRTQYLIATGKYMNHLQMQDAMNNEREELATKIYFFFRDQYGSYPKFLESVMYLDAKKQLKEMLKTENGIDTIREEIRIAIKKIDSGEVSIKWRLKYSPEDVLEEVCSLTRKKVPYPDAKNVELLPITFITEDEVEEALRYGSSIEIEGGKNRIHDFFLQHKSKKERIDFLKKEYGIGGRSPGIIGCDRSDEKHDAKGICLKKEGNLVLQLSWNQVEKKLDGIYSMQKNS